ncbi:quinoprotein relay system zinc metallohydrolase 2 [uncultured Thiodictyon sp.]|uniref:quinoprotein relay system zinc metallohydrolase 2 n=1 Tax=uncultured Thiodictyon sp. TaxID=1846217 RepID=UPI0025D6AE6A|nr:quinoprotein relay system zinc metallohydrolase 2 [uncultured Thiodictyon sp.]
MSRSVRHAPAPVRANPAAGPRPRRVLCLCLWVLLLGTAPAWAADLAVSEVAPGVYLHQGAQEETAPGNAGHIANLGFIVGDARVAVIDTGGTYAQGLALRAAVRRVTDLPIAYVVLTHVHPDHVLGAAAFEPDGPEFIGHANLPDALARRGEFYRERAAADLGEAAAGTRVLVPQSVVTATRELDLGGRTLELRAHPTAHTNNDLSILDRASGTLWASDLLFVDRVPAIDGSLLGWLGVLDDLERGGARRLVPGHGPVPADWHAAIAAQRRYLQSIAAGVRAVLRRRGTLEEAVAEVGLDESGRWLLFDDYHRRNVTAAFVELEWE